MFRSELSLLLYPVFVNLFIELVLSGHSKKAQEFFYGHHQKQESFYEEELLMLKSITSPQQMIKSEIFEVFRKNKFTIRISSDSFQCLVKHLQINQHTLILNIVNKFLNLDVFDGTPRTRIDIVASVGAMEGEASAKANKNGKVLHGIPRDPELAAALMVQMEEEENENNGEDDKPKKKKSKKDPLGLYGKKGKAANIPHAPPLSRIPVPRMRECEKNAKYTAFKESAKCIPLGPSHLPSICMYTLMNTHGGLNGVSISEDSTLLSGSFGDSIIRVWTLTPRKLFPLKSAAQLQKITLGSEDISERILDMTSSSEVRLLTGHSGPVFATSFNPDNTFLISGSEDGTVRLWSLQLYTCLVSFKGHNYPVWDVQFSPLGFYFASASLDKTVRVWSTDQTQPVRILAGHLSDVDCLKFHPNGNYIATGSTDRSVRLWDIVDGRCVRLWTGHKGTVLALNYSPDGKYLASSGVDRRILLWDLGSAAQVCELKGHQDTVYQLAFSRDGTLLASGGGDCCVKLWDTTNFEETEKSMDSSKCLLGNYRTKSTAVNMIHFTRKNLLLVSGPFSKDFWQ